MADARDEIQAALEEAKRAREEADRVRREAKQEAERLRGEAHRARDEARRLRDEARREAHRQRDEARRERRGPPGGFGPNPPRTAFHMQFKDDGDAGDEGTRTEHSLSLAGVRSVHVNQTAGKLTVRGCHEGETPGITSWGNKSTPEINVTRDADHLHIEVKLSKGWLFRRRQGATTTIRLENQAFQQFRIENGYGETEVQGIAADELRVNVGAGSIQCILTRGHLDVNVGAGKVSVLSHSGLARCDSGTGDVLLDVAELAHGDYRVDVGLGRAEVRLPAGAEVHVKAASGIGKSRIEYPSAGESAPTRLRLNSGIGECVVKQRDAGASAASQQTMAAQAKPQRPSRAAAASSRRREAEEMRVLQMLEQGKISPQDAADLIAALQGSTAPRFDGEDEDEAPAPFA